MTEKEKRVVIALLEIKHDLEAKLAQVARERDAAKQDIREMLVEQGGNLDLCHWCGGHCENGAYKCETDAEWRGPCAVNTEGGVSHDMRNVLCR